MWTIVGDYFRNLSERFGQGWNRFWFAPSDPLTLSVVRVLAGAIAFYTLLTFTPDLELFFGPDGLWTPEAMFALQGPGYFGFSYLYLLHAPGQLWAAHLAGLAVLGLFTLGLFTRVTAVLSFLVMLSYFQRAFFVTAEMEPVLAFVLLYLCLGPSGAYLSLDRFFARRRLAEGKAAAATPPSWAATVAVRLIQVHLTLVYVMMVLGQLNENTWWDGTAMWWLAGRPDSALVDLLWLHEYPKLVNLWTHSFVFYEAAFAVLAWNRLAAPLMVALGVVVWGLLAIVTGLVPLAAIMVVASLAFIPPDAMRAALGCCGLGGVLESSRG
ncbi:MAG: hypothetical protein HYX69_21780 [Planctomycetia bacterium]|nr:hypothetical protein [Planctomycetia bacterium]